MVLFSNHKRNYIVAVVGILSCLTLSFQNCSRTKFTPGQEEESSASVVAPEVLGSEKKGALALKLTHVSGQREFTVQTTNLDVQDSNCKIQYEKNKTTWTDLSDEFACGRDIQGEKFFLPSTDNWTNNFNATGVRLRIVKVSDGKAVAQFTQNLTCTPKAVSLGTATPNIDENCNGQWDDSVLGAVRNQDVNSLSYVYGGGYNCAATYAVGTKVVPFTEHRWEFIVWMHTDSLCAGPNYSRFTAETQTSVNLSGSAPAAMVSTGTPAGCWDQGGGVYASFADYWNVAVCRYTYREDTSYY